jgi:guanylate kinase
VNPVPGHLWIVSAPSGAGKTSLTRAAVEALRKRGVDAAISVSCTTRAPRPGERDGEHYHFLDEARFVELVEAGAFLEHAEVFGRRYGTRDDLTQARLDAGCELFLDIDWQGARQIRARRPDAGSVFILPPALGELERRLHGRGQDDAATIAHRLAEARAEIAHWEEYAHLIVNDDFDAALESLLALVLCRRLTRTEQAARHGALIAALLGEAPAAVR